MPSEIRILSFCGFALAGLMLFSPSLAVADSGTRILETKSIPLRGTPLLAARATEVYSGQDKLTVKWRADHVCWKAGFQEAVNFEAKPLDLPRRDAIEIDEDGKTTYVQAPDYSRALSFYVFHPLVFEEITCGRTYSAAALATNSKKTLSEAAISRESKRRSSAGAAQ